MKIAVIGASGQLGSDVSAQLKGNGDEVTEITHSDIEITRKGSCERIKNLGVEAVINTAAFHNTEKCEEEPEMGFRANALGARNVAEVCGEAGLYLIHISTDYVFDGAQKAPYVETDLPAPLNVYANTKLSGEHFVLANAPNALVLRTSGLYGKHPCRAKGGGYNFVELMLKLARERDEVRVVDNEVLTPTSTLEVARQVVKIVHNPFPGICHGTAEGSCSWYKFAKTIYEIMEMEVNLNVAAPGEFGQNIKRPGYSVLENKNLKDRQLNTFKQWEKGLREYLLETRG